jgi:hypothetical protein
MEGISSRHGGHHVAQKFKNTTLPLCRESVKFNPVVKGRVKSVIGIPSATTGILAALNAFMTFWETLLSANIEEAAAAVKIKNKNNFFIFISFYHCKLAARALNCL